MSLSPLSGSWIWLLGALVLAGWLMVAWSYRGARHRYVLGGMRLMTALLVIGFLTEPAVQLRVVRKIRNRLAILVDDSKSMSLATEAGPSRYDNVRALLSRHPDSLATLGNAHIIEWFDLDGPLPSPSLKGEAVIEKTDLLTALETARERGAGRPLAGLVVISDGADNVGLEGTERGTLTPQALERLERLGAPVNTIDATGNQEFKDVAVADVISDEFAFVHNTLEIEVIVESVGFEALTVPTTLRREGDVVATQEAVLRSGQEARVRFKIKPDQIGEFVYSVSIPPFAGEAIPENNVRSFVIQVIRDKIRVLQVAGKPSWDERFLRQHLKENPNVDLISFFILRTPTDDPSIPENELSLIPFPVDKIFRSELHTFDVIVFQDFDYRPYRMEQYLRDIRDAVKGGLGFVMVGGAQSFADGGYLGTELDEIIPVDLTDGGLHEGTARLSLTQAGKTHPVTDLSRGRGGPSNDKIWKALPTWSAVNRSGGLVPNATALVVHPEAKGPDGSPIPLVSVMDAGEGRSMAVASDSMWRWRFSQIRDGGVAERAYHRFWSNALRWLVRDPEHSRVRVLPERRHFDVGDEVEVSFVVLGQDYQPVPFAHVRATLERADGTILRVDDLSAGEGGIVRHRYEEQESGPYRIRAEANASGEALGQGRGVFVVESRSVELSRGAPRPDLLRAVARATRGNALDLEPDPWERLEVVDPDVVEVDRRRNVELWDNVWAMIAGIVILGAEWALRRRRGYL